MAETTHNNGSTEVDEAAPPWNFEPLPDYAVPTLPAGSAAAMTWASLRQMLRRKDLPDESPANREDELRALSQLRLQHLARPIDWAAAAKPLHGPTGAGQAPAVRRPCAF